VTVVLDASLLLALVLNEPHAPAVSEQVSAWGTSGEALVVPALAWYEIASGIAKALAAGRLDGLLAAEAASTLSRLPISTHTLSTGVAAVALMAQRLSRTSAYDGAYLVRAEELGATLWTLDGPLYRNAVSIGAAVRLVE
jgi:predicted nucleic acid-binding protein